MNHHRIAIGNRQNNQNYRDTENETQLYYCSEKKGVLSNIEDNNSVIQEINSEYYIELVDAKVITEGMLPKLHNCFRAIEKGVNVVLLGDAVLLSSESVGASDCCRRSIRSAFVLLAD